MRHIPSGVERQAPLFPASAFHIRLDTVLQAARPPALHDLPAFGAGRGFIRDVDDQPFFCRIEYRIGQKTRVPFKFRLGSVDYVDKLEGKPWTKGL